MFDLNDKVILITGGAAGVGTEIVREFAKYSPNIAFTYNNSNGDFLIEELADINIKGYKFNQKNIEEINPLIEKIIKDFNKIDILINNAGIYPNESLYKITENSYDEMLDINLKGIFFLCREIAKHMDKGNIINISSINANNPASKLIHYGISKAGIEMLTKCLAYELGPNIRVNCIAPGLIYREGQEKFIPGWRESYIERSALHRLVEGEEVGKTALFLASDMSSGITGQIITVDCGVSLAPYFNNHIED